MSGQLDGVLWKKSTRSNPSGNCVEVRFLPDGGAAVRDGKDPQGSALIFTKPEWVAFLGGAQDGEFDLPA
ncbi:DUF397 domain-containing protein [Micromonosporaceae bacterium Da 78-11]